LVFGGSHDRGALSKISGDEESGSFSRPAASGVMTPSSARPASAHHGYARSRRNRASAVYFQCR
jgi:hypothetical protein